MADLLIRDIPEDLKRDIERQAKSGGRSLSEQAKRLIAKGIQSEKPRRNLGDEMLEIFKDGQLSDQEHDELWGEVERLRKTDKNSSRKIPFSE